MKLTGNEPWVVAGTNGAAVFARQFGINAWWPVVEVELDCGLIIIDVCGMRELWNLSDCAQLKVDDEIVNPEDFQEEPSHDQIVS